MQCLFMLQKPSGKEDVGGALRASRLDNLAKLARIVGQRCTPKHARAPRTHWMPEDSRSDAKQHTGVRKESISKSGVSSRGSRYGGRMKFVEVTVQTSDLWARLAWVSRSLNALAVKAMVVFRQANNGWMTTQADDLARQIAKGGTGRARNVVRNLSGKEISCTDVKAQVSANGVALASQREKAIRTRRTCHGGVQR